MISNTRRRRSERHARIIKNKRMFPSARIPKSQPKLLTGCSDSFEPTVWVLGKSRNQRSVVHSVWLGRIKIASISWKRRLHFAIAGWVLIFVIDTKEIGVASWVWSSLW
jgi:hypothetical protein